jgi:hypothetical protein
MITYTLNKSGDIVIREDENSRTYIPIGSDSTEYREYLAWLSEGNEPTPYAPLPPPVPQQISDRQFFQQAAVDGLITQDEALAAVSTGAIPAVLQTIVDGITDPAEQFVAKMLLSGATVFERTHPFTEAVAAALGWTSEQINGFFVAAYQL